MLDKLKFFIVGPPIKNIRKVTPAFKTQVSNLKKVWNNETYTSIGIERVVRLFLTSYQFLSPGLYLRQVSGLYGLLCRKICVEIFVVLLLLLPILFLFFSWTGYCWVPYIFVYLIIDTLVYVSYLIMLSDLTNQPISYKRSLLALFINYLQVAFSFAVLYSHYNITRTNFFNKKLASNAEAVYFSFITTATIGYGDIYPASSLAQLIVVCQSILFFVFIGLFLNFFSNKIDNGTNYDKKTL